MTSEIEVVRSNRTGKMHRGWVNLTCCNYSGQIRRPSLTIATEAEVAAAPDSAFCKKCFSGGRP